MRLRVKDGDNVFRLVIHPIAFRSKAFAVAKMIHLVWLDQETIVTSLAWEIFLPTAEMLHRYGCDHASSLNQKTLQDRGELRAKDIRVYCGSYQLRTNLVRGLAAMDGLDGVASADVVHLVEDGKIAHVNLEIKIDPEWSGDLEGTKTAIIDRLWNACRGPLRHVCRTDAQETLHPSAALEIPPSGEYTDTRTSMHRWCSIVRCHLLEFVWGLFGERDSRS